MRRRPGHICSAVICVIAAPAFAVNCGVSTAGVAFGAYDPFSAVALDSAGDIAISCDSSVSYTVSLSSGSGSYAGRHLAGAGDVLVYNLYTNASRSTVWGDGGSGSAVVSGTGSSAHQTVYGRIRAGQNPHFGSYADNVTITVGF